MPFYKYEAMDSTGNEIKSYVESPTEESAKEAIRKSGHFVTKIFAVNRKIEDEKKVSVVKKFGIIAIIVCVLAIVGLLFGLIGGRNVSAIFRGNVYSCGYRDVYIQGQSIKPDKITGLGRVHEIKCGFYGWGSGVDAKKPGQDVQGSWVANHFSDELRKQIEKAPGNQLYRVFYVEKDFTFSGSTKYHVLGLCEIPILGEDTNKLQAWTDKMIEENL